MLEQRANGANTGFVEAGGNEQLVGEEQGFVALKVFYLTGCMALVGIAAQLVYGRSQRLRHGWALAFHHHQGDAIHQQHQVRHDEGLASVIARRAVHAILIDHRKGVVLRYIPVNKANGLAAAAIPAWQAVYRQAQQQQLSGRLICFDEFGPRNSSNCRHRFGNTLLIQPRHRLPSHFAQVNLSELLSQHALLNDLGKAVAASD